MISARGRVRAVAVSVAAIWCLSWMRGAWAAQQPRAIAEPAAAHTRFTDTERLNAIRRAQVWMPTDIPSMDLKAGPPGPGSFAPEQLVSCDYMVHERRGHTAKFWCAVTPQDVVKVRYRPHNGEVYAQVAATRLFWALGFGADRAYPVKVACRGCSQNPWANDVGAKSRMSVFFDPATIDRKMSGDELETTHLEGWAWKELDLVDEATGGASLAQRDALKLLAVFVQHTDSKRSNQALTCLDEQFRGVQQRSNNTGQSAIDAEHEGCAHPFMMVRDLGNTFGHANVFSRNVPSSVNFEKWSQTQVWRSDGKAMCVGHLSGSIGGTLDDPRISEAGRKFLADLLVQLSDAQLHELFETARFTRRDSAHTVDEWVTAFKQKRDEIVKMSCPP